MSIEKIKELQNKARQIESSIPKHYLEFRESLTGEILKIKGNKKYSESGKRELVEHLKKRKTVELMKWAREQYNQYDMYLREAYLISDRMAYRNIPKADAQKRGRFHNAFNDFKTELIFTNRPDDAIKKLRTFIEKTEEYEFISDIKREFSSLAKSIIEITDKDNVPKVRKELADLFEHTKNKSLPQESHEAFALLEQIESAVGSRIFNRVVQDAIKEDLGSEAAEYINKPNEFFEKYPEMEKIEPGIKTMEESLTESRMTIELPSQTEANLEAAKMLGRRVVGRSIK